MSNPMLAGLGSLLKPGDKRFELPPIKDPNGKGAGYAPKAPPEVEKAKEETAKQAENEGSPAAEKEMDISIGLLLGMAATCVTAHGEKEFGETAAYFWREASNDMRLKNNPRDEKWADWATDNAQKLDVIVTKERVKPKKKKEPVLDAELGKFGITVEQRAGYAKAKAYAKKCREKEKGEGKHGHIGRGGGGAGAEKSKGGQFPKGSMPFLEEDDDAGRPNKNYWKKEEKPKEAPKKKKKPKNDK